MPEGGQLETDKDRVTVLLLINSLLIKKAHEIYVKVLSNRLAIQQMPPQSRQNILEQYNNINRRLQCNLSVLSYLESSYNGTAATQLSHRIEFPVILSPPPEIPELRLLYKRLQELYPEAIEFLKVKMQQLKLQQESQIKPSHMSQASQASQTSQVPQVSQQSIQQVSQRSSSRADQHVSQQNLQAQQRHHFLQKGYPAFNSIQGATPPQYHSPQVNIAQTQMNLSQQFRHGLANVTSKIPVQHHLPQQNSKHLDVAIQGGISPQMMSKESESTSFNNQPTLMGATVNNNMANMLSISPQQILQQRMQPNDLSMEFL